MEKAGREVVCQESLDGELGRHLKTKKRIPDLNTLLAG